LDFCAPSCSTSTWVLRTLSFDSLLARAALLADSDFLSQARRLADHGVFGGSANLERFVLERRV